MSFLLHHYNNFFLIDYASRYGVFCQLYSPSGISRPMQLQPNVSQNYSATLDENGNPHVISIPTPYRITYLHYENNRFAKKTLIENSSETTAFSNPMIHFINNELHIFYLANKTNTTLYTLVHYNMQKNTFETLLETPYIPKNIKSTCTDGVIYIFYTAEEDSCILQCLKISDGHNEQTLLVSSKNLIFDYSFCIHQNEIYLCYVWESYGKYELIYYHPSSKILRSLANTFLPSAPTLFWYYNELWINYLDDNKLYVLLSVDHGYSFSRPILSSMQVGATRHSFFTLNNTVLHATQVYATTQNTVRINTVATLDFQHIHHDITLPIELELLIEGLRLSQTHSVLAKDLTLENTRLKDENKILENKYQQLLSQTPITPPLSNTRDTSEIKSIQSAATTFMGELSSWDALPRI